MLQVQSPFQQFFDADGSPLEGGSIYIGTPNANPETNPVAVYWDDALTIPAAQPIKTSGGFAVRNGTPARIYVNAEDFSMTVKSKTGTIIFSVLDATSSSTLRTDLALSSGASLVGYAPLAGPTTTVQAQLRKLDLKTVNVQDYVTGGLGTSASPWTGWDTAITWTASTQYDFLDGYYSYATSPNFAKDYLCLNSKAGTVIRHTGTGYALLCDAGAVSQLVTSVRIDVRLEGNPLSTGGIFQRACVHSFFKCKFHDVPSICFTDVFGVLNDYILETSALVVGQTNIPTNLLAVNKRGTADVSSANRYYLIAENCSAQGVVLNDCVTSLFIGGTSETNGGGGYFISASCSYNTFLNIDLEANTGYDISCLGSYNTFIGTLSDSIVTMNGSHNIVQGGIYNTINSGGAQNVFGPLAYSANGGLFVETGSGTTKRSVFKISGGTMDLDIIMPIVSANSGSGSVTAANNSATTLFALPGTGRYEIFAYISSADAVNFASSATVLQEGGGARRIIANNGTLLAISLSGANVQATQTSGASQTVSYSFLRIN